MLVDLKYFLMYGLLEFVCMDVFYLFNYFKVKFEGFMLFFFGCGGI